MIEGQTNVRSSRFGAGAVQGLGAKLGRFVVTTMEIPWRVTKDRIGAQPSAILMVESMEEEVVERQIASAPVCDAVLAIGGGQAIDLGKYLAWKRGVRLVSVPTVISVDAFVTPQAAIRKNHRVEYVGQSSPDPLVIDYELLRTAPPALNVAGAGDLLSIHTATRDWEIAHEAGADIHHFRQADVDAARAILKTVEDHADDIRRNTDVGLRTLVEGYMRVNTLCLPVGHYRVEEGSEHFLFYELEERLGRPFLHGTIIGLGVYLMSHLQRNEPERVTRLMNRLGLDYQPGSMGIDRAALRSSLSALKTFARKRNFWYSVIDRVPIEPSWIDRALDSLRFEGS